MKKFLLFSVLMLIVLFEGCGEKAPVAPDGESKMVLRALWNNSTDSIPHYVPMPNAKVVLSSEYGIMVKNTDENGVLELNGIPSAVYNVSVRMQHPMDASITIAGNKLSIETSANKVAVDTIIAKPVSNSGISINEIYAAGAVSHLYFYDQFIELYNSSDSVKYLDGMMVMRFTGNTTGRGPGADEGSDGDIDGASYTFKFPGNPGEKNYPFPPKKFIVLAQNAIDHRTNYTTSIDLSKADWEFYNQFSTKDMDNTNVPNLLNMNSAKLTDFIVSLDNDVIVISNGKDQDWSDGIDIATVLDAVEYQPDANRDKTLDTRIDRGFVMSPSQYSGKSMQRREAGVDTNDGSLDWEILPHPTPGYQK